MGVKVILKALRANNNMTQPQLAEKLGVSASTVQSQENKDVQPRADQIAKLLNLVHVNFEDVVFAYFCSRFECTFKFFKRSTNMVNEVQIFNGLKIKKEIAVIGLGITQKRMG